MKINMIGLMMGMMMAGASWAGEADWAYAGKTWNTLYDNTDTLTAVGITPSQDKSNQMVVVAQYHSKTTPELHDGTYHDFDYSLMRFAVDCPGERVKQLATRGYRADGTKWEKTYERSWMSARRTSLSQPVWLGACQGMGAALPNAQNHQEVLMAHRKKSSAVAPEIDLARAKGGGDHHWHYAVAAENVFVAVDVHRITPGVQSNPKKMSRLTVFKTPMQLGAGSSGNADYVVDQVLADCYTEGALTSLASAFYRVGSGGGELVAATKSSSASGDKTLIPALDKRTWDWVCKGDQQINAIPSNISFDDMRRMYLDSF